MDHQARRILVQLAVGHPVVAPHRRVSPEIYEFEQMLYTRAERVYEE